jgi:chromate transporter
MQRKHQLMTLFWTFLKIGALTFGGGLAMMPVMRKEVVETHKWVDDDDILKILVISESTPGVFAINSATFIGYRIAGFKGSLLATLGVMLPSLVIILLITTFLETFKSLTVVNHMFLGIQAGIAILILRAGLKLAKKIRITPFTVLMFASAVLVSLLTSVNVILMLVIGAVLGIIYGATIHMKEAQDHGR